MSSRRPASSATGIDLTFSVTNTWCKKLSTSGAWSARSSRHAGLLSRSQATSSKLTTLGGALLSATVKIVEVGADILAACHEDGRTCQEPPSLVRTEARPA